MAKAPRLADLVKTLERYGVGPEPLDAKGRTRARILRAATDLFQKKGYKKTSVDDVARESGVAKGTVYLYFKNKSELLFHAIAEEKKRLVERFRPVLVEDLPPAERLKRYLELAFLTIPEAPLVSKLLSGDREMLLFLEDMAPDLREETQRAQTQAFQALLEGVGAIDRLPPKERAERARALQGLLYAAASSMSDQVRAGLPADRYARQLAKLIVEGIGAP